MDWNQLSEIVNGQVDPLAMLGKESAEPLRDNCFANGLRTKDILLFWKCLEHQCREVLVFTKEQKILLVEGIGNIL